MGVRTSSNQKKVLTNMLLEQAGCVVGLIRCQNSISSVRSFTRLRPVSGMLSSHDITKVPCVPLPENDDTVRVIRQGRAKFELAVENVRSMKFLNKV
jgi:hypothetical protein